jgi:nucleotide-binding universal stress UspA family protein
MAAKGVVIMADVRKQILVPVDFSDCSKPALEYAARLARLVSGDLCLLHVWEVPEFVPRVMPGEGFLDRQALSDLVERRAREDLDVLVREAEKLEIPIASTLLARGVPSRAIVETARRERCDLLVIGTHGRTGFSHVMLGSVAERVVRAAPCPVLTVRPGTRAPAQLRKILVPVDYSEHSSASLKYASELADALHAELDVVHVWDRPTSVPETILVHDQDGTKRSLIEMIRENAEHEMREFLTRLHPPKRNGETMYFPPHRLLSGEPASTLIAELERGEHDMVIVGTRGQTGLKHLLLGSIAEKLVRLSPIPVLTIASGKPA